MPTEFRRFATSIVIDLIDRDPNPRMKIARLRAKYLKQNNKFLSDLLFVAEHSRLAKRFWRAFISKYKKLWLERRSKKLQCQMLTGSYIDNQCSCSSTKECCFTREELDSLLKSEEVIEQNRLNYQEYLDNEITPLNK